MEPVIVMLLFYFVMILANNGLVNVIRTEWYNAANAGAIAGAQILDEEEGSPIASQNAIVKALTLTLLHQWLNRPIVAAQVNVTTGTWENCTFTPDNGISIPNAIRVDIASPVDEEGNPTGITNIFGNLNAPFFEKLPSQITAVAAVFDKKTILVEYQGGLGFCDE